MKNALRQFRKILFSATLAIVSTSALATGNEIGVVVLHGKWDSPHGTITKLVRNLEGAGFVVAAPEMSWSGRRLYDAGVDGVEADIANAANKLREKGAKKIFIAGHSLGAAGAVRYAAQVKVDGVIALSPGHFPESTSFKTKGADSIEKAQNMVAKGAANEKDWFLDPNSGGRSKNVQTTARIYLDFMYPDGPMNFRRNAAAVKPGTPVLWVVGATEEEGLKKVGKFAFDKLPQNPPPRFMEVPGGHMDTPDNATAIVIDWIRENAQ